ncbi:MAG TPA: hypothetical protein VK190_02715 [Pseudoneobacillus sp.]|nr:hypothetical protein [Pseudoneobacillus sp.]
MNNDSYRYALQQVSSALRCLDNACDGVPDSDQKYLYNLEMNEDLYPFHKSLREMVLAFDTYKRKVYDRLDELDLENNLDVESSVIMAGLGYDFNTNKYGDNLSLKDDKWTIEIINQYGCKTSANNNTFRTTTEVEYGTLILNRQHYINRDRYFTDIVKGIKADRDTFKEIFIANRTMFIQKLCEKYDVKFVAITGDKNGYMSFRKFTELRVYDDTGFDETYDTVVGRYENTLADIKRDIKRYREQHRTA